MDFYSSDLNTKKQDTQSSHYAFELGKTLFQCGNFKKSIQYLQEALKQALESKNFSSYLECYHLLFQAFYELCDLENLQKVKKEFNKNCLQHDLKKHPKTYTLDGFFSLVVEKDFDSSFQKLELALKYISDQITRSLKEKNRLEELKAKLYLMDCLYAFATYYLMAKQAENCQKILADLKVCIEEWSNLKAQIQSDISKTINAQEQQSYHGLLKFVDSEVNHIKRIKLGANFIEAQIGENYQQNDQKLWKCYEQAHSTGNLHFVPYVLAYMSINYFYLKEYDQSYTFLNLAEKNLNVENFKILAARIQSMHKTLEVHKKSEKNKYDIIFNSTDHLVVEQQKGCVDFKNQFILIDLLKMFILHPGNIYSKQHLVENVWKQEYSPLLHDNKIYVTIKRLRELIEPNVQKPRYIFRNKQGYYLTEKAKILVK